MASCCLSFSESKYLILKGAKCLRFHVMTRRDPDSFSMANSVEARGGIACMSEDAPKRIATRENSARLGRRNIQKSMNKTTAAAR